MTAADLIEGLRKSGTSEAKLKPIEDMAKNRHASAAEACQALEAAGTGAVTMAKAKHLAAAKPIEALLGTPPQHSAESKEQRLAEALGKKIGEVLGTMQDRAAEKSPGKLVKPTA